MKVSVIGGGAAGAMAALSAAEAGAKVELFRRGYGATALSSGAVDLADVVDEASAILSLQRSAAENLAEMLRRNRFHPLASHVDAVDAALALFCRATDLYDPRSLSLPNLVLPTDLGTWKPTFLAQRSQAGADLQSLQGKRVAVVGFSGWGLFRAPFVAASLQHFAQLWGTNVQIVPCEVDLGHPDVPLFEPHEIARLIDSRPELRDRLPKDDFDLLLVPPVGAALGVELLASDRSVPGFRLQQALDRALEKARVELLGQKSGPNEGVTILATGRFLGGGIVRENARFFEPVFDLPVWIDNQLLGEGFIGHLCGPSADSSHAFLRAGMRVDEKLRPLGADGQVVRQDLFACGSVLTGYDAVRERCGLGTAIVTGYVAGRMAAAE